MDDIAWLAVRLAMNDYMTGQTISVNGGWYMSSSPISTILAINV